MQSFLIEGGRPLQGTITPQGAKNEALEVICAAILTTEEVRISNVPDILDVNNLILLLEDIGVKVTRHAPRLPLKRRVCAQMCYPAWQRVAHRTAFGTLWQSDGGATGWR